VAAAPVQQQDQAPEAKTERKRKGGWLDGAGGRGRRGGWL
jgi:hypothetical protein